MAQRFAAGFGNDRADEGAIAAAFGALHVRLRFDAGEPGLELPERRLQIFDLALQLVDAFAQLVGRGRQRRRKVRDQIALLAEILFGGLGYARLDAPDAAADRRLREHDEHAELAGRMRVRPAAELDRRTGLHDANQLAVLFAGHPNRAGLLGLFERQARG